ncbi:MAG TPA: hypothetical protein VGI60_18820 [Chthoniobacterales bacterium]
MIGGLLATLAGFVALCGGIQNVWGIGSPEPFGVWFCRKCHFPISLSLNFQAGWLKWLGLPVAIAGLGLLVIILWSLWRTEPELLKNESTATVPTSADDKDNTQLPALLHFKGGTIKNLSVSGNDFEGRDGQPFLKSEVTEASDVNIGKNVYRAVPQPSDLTVKRIIDEINAAPPYRRHALSESFEGISVKWEAIYQEIEPSARIDAQSSEMHVRCRTEGEPYYGIVFDISVATYPQFKIADVGDTMLVSGTIKRCNGAGSTIQLDVAGIVFESSSTKKNKGFIQPDTEQLRWISQVDECFDETIAFLKGFNGRPKAMATFHALYSAKAYQLKDNNQVGEVCNRIVDTGYLHPFSGLEKCVHDEERLEFLKWAHPRPRKFLEKGADYVVAAMEWAELKGRPMTNDCGMLTKIAKAQWGIYD